MEATGRIKMIYPPETVGSNGFTKRDIVITTNEQYPQDLIIQFIQDKCDLLNNYQIGQDVKININLRGREWTNPQGEVKYFNTIQGWNIGFLTGEQQPQHTPPPQNVQPQSAVDNYQQNQQQQPTTNFSNKAAEDDLPY